MANNRRDNSLRYPSRTNKKRLVRRPQPNSATFRAEGEENQKCYGNTLCLDDGATLDELREAMTMLEDTERIARRVLGGAHPITVQVELSLREARVVLRARETPQR